jgi:hypothetical protein
MQGCQAMAIETKERIRSDAGGGSPEQANDNWRQKADAQQQDRGDTEARGAPVQLFLSSVRQLEQNWALSAALLLAAIVVLSIL